MVHELKRVARKPRNIAFERKYGPGIDVMAEDWDNLILLDACRYDYFESQINIEGELKSAISRGGHSWEFMQGNFVGREFHDTIYVTANPHVEKLSDGTFFKIKPLLNKWDEDLGTVLPEEVVKAAVAAHSNWPNKRLIVHFMQPHHPFIGLTANKVREEFNIRGYNNWVAHEKKEGQRTGTRMYTLVEEGKIPLSTVHNAYSESLDIVLNKTNDLLSNIQGKTVISADHGEMLGERSLFKPEYGHPHGVYNTELKKVPWFIISSNSRREITTGEPQETIQLDDNIVRDRLEALGYAPDRS